MKRVIFTCFYLLLTLLLSAAGFLLPSSLSAYQDQQIYATIEHPFIEPMELNYSSSLPDTLRLFTKGHYFVDYPRTGSERSADDISNLIKDVFKQLNDSFKQSTKSGIEYLFPIDNSASSYDISLQLAIASEEEVTDYTSTDASTANNLNPQDGKKTLFSWKTNAENDQKDAEAHSASEHASNVSDISTAVVWSCGIYNEAGGYWADIKVDDKSGKIVEFYLTSDLVQFSLQNKNQLDVLVDILTNFLQEYYDMQAEPILQDMLQAAYATSSNQPAILEADYIIQFKEESGNLIQIPLIIREQYIRIN